MSTAAIIHPINDNNNHQILTLLDNSSTSSSINENKQHDDMTLMTEEEEEVQKQQILSYLSKSSPVSSFTSPKRVPRLGPYLLLKTLGVGEFGKVKMGRHMETGQTVAVKLVKKENIDSSSQLEKIRMEIDILKTLNHPYIVKLLSVNETNTCIGMVLEFAQGGELFEYIYRQRHLKENEARRLFAQLISCVYYMHQKNIVHRDLKLENILLDHRGNLIVTDFGFANQFTQITGDLMSTSCGSPVYAAPELVMTGRLYSGTGVDIWSCGIILYAMLCGYLPFDDDVKNPNGDNIGRLYRYIMANKPKYPSHLSHDSKDVIGKMLIPDPAARCKIETIMVHPWLHKYKDQMSKSVQDLELEAQELKRSLLQGIEVKSTTEEDYIEDVCCDEDHQDGESSNSSVCSSVSSSYSYSNTKDTQQKQEHVAAVNKGEDDADSNNENTIMIEKQGDINEVAEEEQLIVDHTSPPATPIPYFNKDTIDSTETTAAANEYTSIPSATTEKLSRRNSHASRQSLSASTTNMSMEHVNDAISIPVIASNENNDKQVEEPSKNKITRELATTTTTATGSSSSSSATSSSSLFSPIPAKNTKRHTIDTVVLTNGHHLNLKEQKEDHRPPMPAQHSSLRAKLFSSVRRRNPSLLSKKKLEINSDLRTNQEEEEEVNLAPLANTNNNSKESKKNKRHSWQTLMHRHSNNDNNNDKLPLSPPLSPTPEHSKSVRLLSWLKHKSPSTSSHHRHQNKSNERDIITPTAPSTSGGSSSQGSHSYRYHSREEESTTIPVARPSSSLAAVHTSNTPSRAPSTVLSLMQQQSSSNNHRDHANNTTNNKIDQISIESELRVHTGDMNRSALTSKPPMEVLLEINKILLILGIEVENQGGYRLHCIRRSTSHYHPSETTDQIDDRMIHLAVSHQPGLSLPIYGHPSIDDGQEIQFSVEICRFENLSGLFSVDIQCMGDENFSGYQFIGQKLLALLHLGNAIRNTNFNLMLSKDSF